MLDWALAAFAAQGHCLGVALAVARGDERGAEIARRRNFRRVVVAAGGPERAHSVLSALEELTKIAADSDWVLVHDAARPCVTGGEIAALLAACDAGGRGGLLAVPVADTVKRADLLHGVGADARVAATEPRGTLWRALTPQMFRLGELRAALQAAAAANRWPTDEAQAMEWCGAQPLLVAGLPSNLKVTTPEDFALAEALLAGRLQTTGVLMSRTGFGTDIHAFGAGDHVMLGGVRVPNECGVVAHSDGDVLLHALCDALLGAAGLGDIGQHFPDSDPRWRGAASAQFVVACLQLLANRGLRPQQADLTLLAELPRIGPYRQSIVARVAELLGLPATDVNLKATTAEGLGFIGRREGLAAQAVVTLVPK